MATGGVNLSKEFFELLKAIGESKSKQEEDRIIAKEVQRLKAKLEPTANPSSNPLLNSKKQAREFLVRLLYVEMLGHDASFGYIKAVEMAASASLYHKRTGYLVCGACLPPTHEFRFMLVNQMQRDLTSPNVLECSGGILACTNLISSDMVPAVAGEVAKLLSHDSATIRKKTIVALHKFYQLASDVVTFTELVNHIRKVLCDRDPSVMGACLNVLEALARQDAPPFKDLVPSLVSILKQINDHRLPSDYDYHRVPAPWLQIKIIRILGVLGHADATTSGEIYEILHMTLKKADTGINAGYAIVYECIQTIVSLYPNPRLLDAAAEAISRFMQSRSHNLKYLGVTGLALIVESHPQYAAQHQLAVLDCLEDSDETLQRKTLDLLYRMTNPVNVEFIADKLLDFLSGTTDLFLKKVLTTRVCSIAEKYAPNNAWYIRTITQLCKVAGDMVSPQVAQDLMSLIAEGTGESEQDDMLLRQSAVEIYVGLLSSPDRINLPKILLETMAWCLGEYGYLSAEQDLQQVLQQLCTISTKQQAQLAPSTRRFLVQAIMKLVAQAGTCPPTAAAVIDQYTKSQDFDLQQRCLEFQKMLTHCPNLLPEVMPVDASAEDVQVDEYMSFLDGIVADALNQGARPYNKPEDDDDEDDYGSGRVKVAQPAFKLTPYAKPQAPAQAMLAMSGMGSAGRSSSQNMSMPPGGEGSSSVPMPLQQPTELQLNTRNVANVWGKGGLKAPAPPAAAPAPPPASNAWGSPPVASASSNTYGSSSSRPPAAPPEPAEKTAQQLEKERMAAALFGGIVPGAAPPPARASSVPKPAAAPKPPPAPISTPAPAPAAEFDLLDMSAWDSPAAAASAPSAFDEQPALEPTPPIAAVETVSDDELELPPQQPVAAPAPDLDPFASAGLLGDVSEQPLASLATSQKFEYNGASMAPLQITTAQFGQKWGSCTATSPVSIATPRSISTLNDFMELCKNIGCHAVEAINATNEGIAAGMVSGSHVVLLHGKLSGNKLDVIVKGTDAAICGSLAIYIQTMLR